VHLPLFHAAFWIAPRNAEENDMPEVDSRGPTISFDDKGAGEPAFLFMSGWCGSWSVFGSITEKCAARRRILALDWRGHGRSGATEGDFGTDALVGDALSVIEASEAESVVPVALSHAGWVAIELRRMK
jgi:pimeloyl-ACP methyl ester carboxylesterase